MRRDRSEIHPLVGYECITESAHLMAGQISIRSRSYRNKGEQQGRFSGNSMREFASLPDELIGS